VVVHSSINLFIVGTIKWFIVGLYYKVVYSWGLLSGLLCKARVGWSPARTGGGRGVGSRGWDSASAGAWCSDSVVASVAVRH